MPAGDFFEKQKAALVGFSTLNHSDKSKGRGTKICLYPFYLRFRQNTAGAPIGFCGEIVG